MSSSVPNITAGQLATAFALRPQLFAWFLGAGASAASGIPTAYAMIRDFRKRIYCRETGYASAEVDIADPLWSERVDEFFRKHAILPPLGDPEEYSAAFEAVYPGEHHRRQYIADAIRKGTPSFAHRVLAALMSNKQVSCVFTTNFDQLIETSATIADQVLPPEHQSRPTVAALDSADRALRCLLEADWPLVAKLHGDYTSIKIKNTNSELERQDERMRDVLIKACTRFGLIVVGYSGRDASVMEALSSTLKEKNAFPQGIYWVTSSRAKLLPGVRSFLEEAVAAGVPAAIVESANFDEFAADLLAQVELPRILMEHVTQYQVPARLKSLKLPDHEAREFPVLRYSALRVDELPRVARRISLEKPVTSSDAREILKAAKARAVATPLGRELIAFGNDKDIVAAFRNYGARVAGEHTLDPETDSRALGLLYDALARALSRKRPLWCRYRRSGHALVVARNRDDDTAERVRYREKQLSRLKRAYQMSLTGQVPLLGFPFQEGVRLKLDTFEDRWWCSFEPFTFVDLPEELRGPKSGGEADELGRIFERRPDPAGDWRRERWATKYNKHWADIIDAWAAMLAPDRFTRLSAFGLRDGEGVDATFALASITGFSRPSHHHPYFERTE